MWIISVLPTMYSRIFQTYSHGSAVQLAYEGDQMSCLELPSLLNVSFHWIWVFEYLWYWTQGGDAFCALW